MQASELISTDILNVTEKDNGQKALSIMEEYHINHIAVVKGDVYLGIISENEILGWENSKEKISNHLNNIVSPSVLETQHLFDIIEILEKNNLSIIPVVDLNKKYKGSISNVELLHAIGKSSAVKSVGGIIVLEMNQSDYSMSEIARIIESNDAKILSSYVISSPDSTKIEVTIKINRVDIDRIIKDFDRFDYTLKASFSEQSLDDSFLDRYESLMRYLNI